jgi:valyl-tRNA synthetase
MKELSTSYNPKDIESKWYNFWKNHSYFKADAISKKPPFCIVIPPPNVTGTLHMGHALGCTLQDIIIRYKRMMDFEVLWVPGTDHAGISTQTVVEKHLFQTVGKRKNDFSRKEFIDEIWKWKEEKEGRILKQLEEVGCSCDWSRLRFTMDDGNNEAVKTVFKKMFDEGLIYQGDYLVNWDTIAQTAIADDEVEHEEIDSFLWYFRYPLVSSPKEYIVVATTRPETMLGDTAIAVNPKDPRYQKLIGKKALLPLMNRPIAIIGDDTVNPEFGSGAVKVTPAHDFNDNEMAIRHNLPLINIMTKDGYVNENGGQFKGLSFKEARNIIVAEMKKQNLLEKIEPHKLRIGISYRSKAVIEPYLSKQWFIKMEPFKATLRKVVEDKKVEVIPEHWEKTYFHWIDNLKDWCISRQLWWGHRIPIWHHKDGRKICYIGEGEPKEVVQDPKNWEQDNDVLDTWFSSALWPFAALGWPKSTQELSKFYPTSLLITGHDILFFWVARMIMMSRYILQKEPFHQVFLHGLIFGKSYWRELSDDGINYVDIKEKQKYDLGEAMPKDVYSKWEKMSKSKGNIIDPLEIIDKYGSDAMRIALCSCATHAREIDIDLRRFEEYKNFSNKFWNASRFILQNLEDNANNNTSALTAKELKDGLDVTLFTLEDRWIFSLLSRQIDKMHTYLEGYEFDKAALTTYSFFWDDVCAYYLELTKPYLFDKEEKKIKKNKQKILAIILCYVVRLLHPIVPFITEEVFSLLKEHFNNLKPSKGVDKYTEDAIKALLSSCCMKASYPKSIQSIDEKTEELFLKFKEIIHTIRNLRAELSLPPAERVDVYFTADDTKLKFIKDNKLQIKNLAKLNNIYFEKSSLNGAAVLLDGISIFMPIPTAFQEKERQRLLKEREKLLVIQNDLTIKLENISKAPMHIIEKTKALLKETEEKLNAITKRL